MPATAHALGPGSLVLGETGTTQEFAAQLTAALLEPSYDADDNIAVLSGEEIAGEETESWELSVTILQSYATGNLSQWLYTNSGTEMPFTFKPRTDQQLTATGRLVVRAGAIGGDVKTKNTAEVTFKVVGRPTITSPAAV